MFQLCNCTRHLGPKFRLTYCLATLAYANVGSLFRPGLFPPIATMPNERAI